MYGVGVIGCGGMGRSHAGYFAALPDVEVVACADPNAEAAQRLAARHNAQAYADAQQLLDDARVQIVAICTPTPFHADLIAASARRGKHIFCEKPVARTLADARRAIEAAGSAGVRLMVGHVLRFFPEYAEAKRLLDEGIVGRPAVARTTRNSGHPRTAGDWFADPDMSGGVLVDMVIHDFDFLRWCAGVPAMSGSRGGWSWCARATAARPGCRRPGARGGLDDGFGRREQFLARRRALRIRTLIARWEAHRKRGGTCGNTCSEGRS